MYLDDLQSKLTILYTLRCFKLAASVEVLQEILVWPGVIDYFSLMNYIPSLIDGDLIKPTVIEEETRYDITRKGHTYINMFKDKIPLSIRDRIYDRAYEILSKLAKGREVAADIVPIDEKKFLAKCGIYEHNMPLMEVSIFAGTREHAEKIAKRFEKNGAKVYKMLLQNIVDGDV